MNVGFSILRGLDLNDEIDARDVKATGSNISCDQHAKLVLLKALKSDFSLILRDITVHDFDVFLDLFCHEQVIRLLLGRGEDNALSTTVANEDVSKSIETVLVGAVDRQMLHGFGCLILQILDEIDHLVTWGQESVCDLLDPPGDGGGEHEELEVVDVWNLSLDGVHDFFDVLFET